LESDEGVENGDQDEIRNAMKPQYALDLKTTSLSSIILGSVQVHIGHNAAVGSGDYLHFMLGRIFFF